MSNSKNEYEVEKIIGKKLVSNKVFYKIKWKDYSFQESTWEPIENLTNIKEMIAKYESYKKEGQFDIKKREKLKKDESEFNSLTMLSLVENEEMTDKLIENDLDLINNYNSLSNHREMKSSQVSIKPIAFGSIENGDVPEEIIGISSTIRRGELEYMIKWKRNKNGDVPFPSKLLSSVLSDAYPKIIIKYLESRINYI